MAVTTDQVRELREITGAGMLDCKKALDEAGGDINKAKEALREKGFAAAAKRADRATGEGLVHAYIHHNQRLGALVEINCETDFVARTEDFKTLVQQVALHVAGANPLFLTEEDMPQGEGYEPKQVCLMLQPFIQDESKTITDLVKETSAKTGENIQIRRFSRFALGQ